MNETDPNVEGAHPPYVDAPELPPAWRLESDGASNTAGDNQPAQRSDDASASSPSNGNSLKSWLIGGGVAAVIAVGAFVGFGGSGSNTAANTVTAGGAGGQATPGQGGFRGGPGGGPAGFVAPAATGTISAISGTTLTVKTTTGSTKVTATSATKVASVTFGTSGGRPTSKTLEFSALKVGQTVRVIGTASNGTVAATAIEEGAMPSFGGGTPPNGAGGAANGNATTNGNTAN